MKKKLKIIELLNNKDIYMRMYSGVRTKESFEKVMEINKKTIKPIKEILEEIEEQKKLYQQKIEDAADKNKDKVKAEVNEAFDKRLNEEVEIEFIKVSEETLKEGNFNAFELSLIEDLINFKDTDNKENDC